MEPVNNNGLNSYHLLKDVCDSFDKTFW